MGLVWYAGKTERTVGLRLKPGWNAINEPTASMLIARGMVTQQRPDAEEFEDTITGLGLSNDSSESDDDEE